MAALDTSHSPATSLKGMRAFFVIISRIFLSNSSIFSMAFGSSFVIMLAKIILSFKNPIFLSLFYEKYTHSTQKSQYEDSHIGFLLFIEFFVYILISRRLCLQVFLC